MSLLDFLALSIQIIIPLVALLTLVDLLRYRNRQRLDIVAMFGSLVIITLIGPFSELTGIEELWLQTLGVMAIVAHPYLLLRLVYHLRPVPRPARWIGLGGMVVFWAVFIISQSVPPFLVLPILAYFVIIEGYAAAVMLERALATGGVNRRRLFLAAAGSGLLVVVILLAVISNILPFPTSSIQIVTQFLAVLVALSYYLGFAPPRWLCRTWQQAELYRFLSEATNRAVVKNPAAILNRLCQAANRVTGSRLAVVAFWDEEGECLRVQTFAGRPVTMADTLPVGEGAVRRAWQERQPAVAHTPSGFGSAAAVQAAAEVGAGTLLAVPIVTDQVQGVLLTFLPGSLFVTDDLALLALLTEQSANALDYINLLAEQQAVTAQLQAANQELESFAYSVSHDLRAPLRAIDGFSQALLEDCEEQLDGQGKGYLKRVRSNTQRMGEIIDALLTLSRLTRTEMNLEPVDLSLLARSITAQLQKREPQRQVEFVIEEDLLVDGDARLLQVALENLLENAWKFSSKRPQARIEFRAMADSNGQAAFFVRDDGTGFDMAYADKLFGAFQRLHAMDDFSGTGIGLATVQRVIHRHGGRLWAEGAPNQGATFYFTL
jgi:signal transduction histidine kinase